MDAPQVLSPSPLFPTRLLRAVRYWPTPIRYPAYGPSGTGLRRYGPWPTRCPVLIYNFPARRYMQYGKPDAGVPNQIAVYGVPATMAEYCEQAQLANFVQYRALVEGYRAKMWRLHTGFLLWKAQSPWAALLGQVPPPPRPGTLAIGSYHRSIRNLPLVPYFRDLPIG